jgi:ABC-type transporter Mla subunit MlaD
MHHKGNSISVRCGRRAGQTALAFILVSLCLSGCQGGWGLWRKKPVNPAGKIDGVRLREALFDFADVAISEVVGASSDIARAATDSRTREMALRWKLRGAMAFRSVVLDPDPRRAMVDTWEVVVKQRQYFDEGGGKRVFGEHSAIAAKVAHRLEAQFEESMVRVLPPKILKVAKTDVERLASKAPVSLSGSSGIFRLRATSEPPTKGGVGDVLSLPLAPLTGLQGVQSTADAIDRIGDMMGVITELVENLPEQARWQAEALIIELEASRSLEDLRAAINESEKRLDLVMKEVKRAVDLAESVPGEVDRQRTDTLDRVSAEREAAVKSMDDLITKQREEMEKVIAGAQEVARKAVAAERDEIFSLVGEEREKIAEIVRGERRAALKDAEERTVVIINHLFWRMIQLACVIFVGLVILVLIRRKRGSSAPAAGG